jgi:hypothetical protein
MHTSYSNHSIYDPSLVPHSRGETGEENWVGINGIYQYITPLQVEGAEKKKENRAIELLT